MKYYVCRLYVNFTDFAHICVKKIVTAQWDHTFLRRDCSFRKPVVNQNEGFATRRVALRPANTKNTRIVKPERITRSGNWITGLGAATGKQWARRGTFEHVCACRCFLHPELDGHSCTSLSLAVTIARRSPCASGVSSEKC